MRYRLFMLFALTLALAMPAAAQTEALVCNPELPARLAFGLKGYVTETDNPTPVRVRAQPGTSGEIVGRLEEGTTFNVKGFEPVCAEGITWFEITTGDDLYAFTPEPGVIQGWIAEGAGDTYFVEPMGPQHAMPSQVVGLPVDPPQVSSFDYDLPSVSFDPAMPTLEGAFAAWNWPPDEWFYDSVVPADPFTLSLPDAYSGNMPSLPVDLNEVAYLDDADLTEAQLANLARNGFVVVPAGEEFFGRSLWQDMSTGRSNYLSADMMLSNVYYIYRYALMFLEGGLFYDKLVLMSGEGLQGALAQLEAVRGTELEDPALRAAAYYAVTLQLLNNGTWLIDDPSSVYSMTIMTRPSLYLEGVDPEVLALAQPVVEAANTAAETAPVPFLTEYSEDFSLYRPRSHYANDELLSAYFRAITWMGRTTFAADVPEDNLAGLLALRALAQSDGGMQAWADFDETLRFLIGPADNISPGDALPVAQSIFGDDLPLENLNDAEMLDAYADALGEFPPPAINSRILPPGTDAESMREAGIGLRMFGTRYALDAAFLQRLIDPDIPGRVLPVGLDLAAAMGSDTAYSLVDAAGLASFAEYPGSIATMREEINSLTPDNWLENAYGGWLWSLEPLLVRDPALEPPLMQTDAWRRKELTTMLASWAALKNATAAYVAPPGGLGGGGETIPLNTYTTVEPNPLAFARIAIFSQLFANGLEERGFTAGPMSEVLRSARVNAALSAMMAEAANYQISGEQVPDDIQFYFQMYFNSAYGYIRIGMTQFDANPPRNNAVTAVAATSPAGKLQVGAGLVDYIYVVSDRPEGLQLTRGEVYSYYEYINGELPLTDDEWRDMLDAGEAPPRPEWVDLYMVP